MVRAMWKDQVIAESDVFETVEGNTYFPSDALRSEFFRPSNTTTVCPWKGTAHYYSIVVNGEENTNAAWFYPDPKSAVSSIKDHVAFWKGVIIER